MALLRERRGAVEIVTFNRPEALNALNRQTFEELEAALDEIERDDAVGAMVFTGAGEKSFVAGADIRQFVDLDVWTSGEFAERTLRLFRRIEESPKPSIAAVNGFCLGGGVEFSLSCDVRIGAENARFGQPEVNLGIIPGWGGTQRLQRLVGPGWARQLILTGDMIDAQTALRIGLINELLPQPQLLERAVQIAQRMGGRARRAVALAKQAIQRGAEMPLAEGLKYETAMWQIAFESEDRREGVGAFLEKREPKFKGR
ncbi:MAG: enoyl-CoA hydratase-related protein [Thermaerobacter sp.]|nr:enoyl-CoA hydratase-related protein [Thermaerobacter sp.]